MDSDPGTTADRIALTLLSIYMGIAKGNTTGEGLQDLVIEAVTIAGAFVPIGTTPGLPAPTLLLFDDQPVALFPEDWLSLVTERPEIALIQSVGMASVLLDYVNGRYDAESLERRSAWMAEAILLLRSTNAQFIGPATPFEINYPKGIASPAPLYDRVFTRRLRMSRGIQIRREWY